MCWANMSLLSRFLLEVLVLTYYIYLIVIKYFLIIHSKNPWHKPSIEVEKWCVGR